MDTETLTALERAFSALSREERETIIRHGVALRVTDLKKRLFLAESKIRSFAEWYQTTLEQLDTTGLPDDASYEMHEDYLMWHHWVAVAQKVAQDMQALQDIAQHGEDHNDPGALPKLAIYHPGDNPWHQEMQRHMYQWACHLRTIM